MIRLIIILAIAFGAYWCYNNIDFGAIADNAASKIQNEKTIKAVTQGRQQNANDVEDALNR